MQENRYNGKFCKKNIVKWKNNVARGNRSRSKDSEDSSGCRMMNYKVLAKELWCTACDKALSFRDALKESRSGLASIFDIKCRDCKKIFQVGTSTFTPGLSSRPSYTINTKIVTGVIESGAGNTHLNKILTACDVPAMHSSTFKRCERKVGVAIENSAAESCLENLRNERESTIQKEGLREKEDWNEDSIVYVTASYDAGWQKKGSGRSYNSLTGHGTAIGFYTGKVIGFATRNKRCSTCEHYERALDMKENTGYNVVEKKAHDCRKNFEGSSKAMEADMAVEIFLQNEHFNEVNVKLGTLIGDDDSSTLSRLRNEADHEIKKWSDKNHAVCKLSKCLYAISMSTPLVKYFKYCFSCVLEKNKNDANATREGILNITPHAFDEHSKCGDWCKYTANPDSYKHKILPGGKGLRDTGLRQKLQEIFNLFANVAEKLCPCASSQGNESLNRIIASKAPKQLHYGGSSSNDIRVSLAILQKNVGNTSIEKIYDKMGHSPPSKLSQQFRLRQDEISIKRTEKAQTIEFKKRRRELTNFKSNSAKNATRREGICYESGCGLDLGIDFVDQPNKLSVPRDLSFTEIVYFDIETTGLGREKEIIQIAAKSTQKQFEIYIMPLHGIETQASLVTGLTVCGGELCYRSTPVISYSKEDAAKSFIQFLNSIGKKLILLAHNCFRFDCPAIIDFIEKVGFLSLFTAVVVGFADSLPIFRAKLKDKRGTKASYTQAVLAEEFLGSNSSSDAHNAINDVYVLQKLVEHPEITISFEDVLKNVKSTDTIISEKTRKKRTDYIKKSFECLKYDENKESGLSNHMINKIAAAGITMENLQQSISANGLKGIQILLGQDIGGKPRVTKNQKIIDRVYKKLQLLVAN